MSDGSNDYPPQNPNPVPPGQPQWPSQPTHPSGPGQPTPPGYPAPSQGPDGAPSGAGYPMANYPGQGYPPGGYPGQGYAPAPPDPPKKSNTGWLVGGAILVVALVAALVWALFFRESAPAPASSSSAAESKPSATTPTEAETSSTPDPAPVEDPSLAIGSCVVISGSNEDAMVTKAACDDKDTASWMIVETLEPGLTCTDMQGYYSTTTTTYCLEPNLYMGVCYTDFDTLQGLKVVSCDSDEAVFKVDGMGFDVDDSYCEAGETPKTFGGQKVTYCLVAPN